MLFLNEKNLKQPHVTAQLSKRLDQLKSNWKKTELTQRI